MGIPEALESDVTKLREQISNDTKAEAKARLAAEKIAEAHKASGVDLSDLEDPTAAEAFTEIDEAFKAADALADRIVTAKDRQRGLLGSAAREAADSRDLPAMSGVVTLAERFTESAEYKAAVAAPGRNVAPQSVNLMSAKETMSWMTAGCPANYHLAATVDGSPLVPIDQQLIPPVEVPVRQVQLLSLYNQATTNSELVRYAQQDTRTDVAAETPYGTDSPEATYAWSTVDVAVKRITQFVPVPLDNLMDQGALSGIINGQLGTGVRLRLESQTLNGDGTGDNLTGILNTAGIGAIAGLDKTVPDVIHEAITAVRLSLEDDVTGVVIHPTDYEAFALTKDSAGMYVNLQSPATATARTIWGYPAIVTTAIAQGTTLVGNFRAGATLWNRMGLTLEQGSQHSDYFIKGLVAYMATVRAAFAAVQPAAFAAATGVGTVT